MFNLTASYAQTGRTIITEQGDTITCYTNSELKKIATRVVRANECDTLLSIKENRILALDTAVSSLQNEVAAKDSSLTATYNVIKLKDQIIDVKERHIDQLDKSLTKQKRRNKWLRAGWIGSSVIFTTIISLISIN